MTREEAIKILRSKIRTDSFDESFEEIMMDCALTMAIADMEKQIPKKVIFEADGEELLCPSCGFDFMGAFCEPDHDPYYCFECGQALDWGEEND